MPGEMLAARNHAIVQQAIHHGHAESANLFGVCSIRPIADNGIRGIAVHVQHGRHVHVDPDCTEFFGGDLRSAIGHVRSLTGSHR